MYLRAVEAVRQSKHIRLIESCFPQTYGTGQRSPNMFSPCLGAFSFCLLPLPEIPETFRCKGPRPFPMSAGSGELLRTASFVAVQVLVILRLSKCGQTR